MQGGSSPRMRGTPVHVLFGVHDRGIIPAYAGNTGFAETVQMSLGDHPRVCGEHALLRCVLLNATGSSPRMRGTRCTQQQILLCHGIIPAYAGNTLSLMGVDCRLRDHPRVCGEHGRADYRRLLLLGSSPRMRGTQAPCDFSGPSGGIIPAYAGNTLRDYSNFVVSKFMSFVFHLV